MGRRQRNGSYMDECMRRREQIEAHECFSGDYRICARKFDALNVLVDEKIKKRNVQSVNLKFRKVQNKKCLS